MILDTTALIDLLRGEKKVKEKIKELEERNISFSSTTISIYEIWQGTKDIKDKVEKIQDLLESINILVFDAPSAKEAGKIHATLKKEGNVIDPEDSMIAGIAVVYNKTILTRNIKHFSRIKDLKVESY